jgi:preprotein translocase subunit YajC
MSQWLAVIGSILACIIGLWKYFGRKAAERRKQAEQAMKELDEAEKNKDTSGITSAVDDINRL